ncbi:hypothetical protein [Actinomadura macra]|uniref:hypothetical protein n=1 Tax=Actinomadura macra TaxID=46164 RepID=UPI00082CE5D3|nr:hypothetical protein [Actinomadura macra]
MVMAYRVERAGSYKIRVDKTGKITSFNATDDEGGVSISFVLSDHSDYFAEEHKGERGVRVVRFAMKDDFYGAIRYLKKMGKESDWKAGKQWLENKNRKKLSAPSGSDGSSLTSFTKKTALTFDAEWLPHLLAAVDGRATVDYKNEETEVFPAVDEAGESYGEMLIADIREAGLLVDQDAMNEVD